MNHALPFLQALFSMPGVADALIEKAKETPYFDLQHTDQSLYMGRYWLHPYGPDNGFAARIHHIATPDLDGHLHDHPWDFVSIVLRGGYTEAHQVFPTTGKEYVVELRREIGHIAFRSHTYRHQITQVDPDTYTLFITGPKVQEWGFYTPEGKVYWKVYLGIPENRPAPSSG